MVTKDIYSALKQCSEKSSIQFSIDENDFLTPSYIVTIAAYIKKKGISSESLKVTANKHYTYLNTIEFYKALWDISCPSARPNVGNTYSVLTLLDNEESTNEANTQIISCINSFTSNYRSDGLNDLKEVIGEVHDNVWSHGKSTGFSMTQSYKNGIIEFALADCGGGFLKELRRVGLDICSHKAAIEWCIKKGNSSKKIEADRHDDWIQQLPSDAIGNPMGKSAKYRKSNNHAGLGLAKLIELIQQYNGTLHIISGDSALSIHPGSPNITYVSLDSHYWDGVVIMCKLNEGNLKKEVQTSADTELSDILDLLTN